MKAQAYSPYSRSLSLSLAIVMALASVFPSAVTAQSTNGSSTKPSNLITNNPFAPAPSQSIIKKPTVSTPTNSGTLSKYLQFKSIAIIDGKKYFSILNRRQNKSYWIPEGETVDSISVTNYNLDSNTATLSDGVNSESISIISADEKPMNVVAGISTPNTKDIKTIQPPKPSTATTATATSNSTTAKKNIPRRRVAPSVKKK